MGLWPAYAASGIYGNIKLHRDAMLLEVGHY
jgi:hypothetical protein